MIRLENISKTFSTAHGEVEAVKEVSLHIREGEIYGIIGYSGAGKSTLVRCMNLLEVPESGHVFIHGTDITSLSEKKLREKRLKIGMIFQQFNLLASRTVFENIAFPLRYRGLSKESIQKKVLNLLKIVDLEDKEKAYPSQLSGGQKQRVAIARSLANDPDILLCDEATSALDPQMTESILSLLKKINRDLNLTVVIITHEMKIIKDVCDKVAIMKDGRVVESDTVLNVFSNPKQRITKDFINSVSNLSKIEQLIENKSSLVNLIERQQLLKLDFHGASTKEAVISSLSRLFNTSASIIFANVEVIQDSIIGTLIVIFDGQIEDQKKAINFLLENEIKVEVLQHA